MPDEKRQKSIWLEVSNVRLENQSVLIQFRGDKEDDKALWWKLDLKTAGFKEGANDAYRSIAEGLDKKKIVIARLNASEKELKCTSIRIQFAESNSR